jgi:hypothetical protein
VRDDGNALHSGIRFDPLPVGIANCTGPTLPMVVSAGACLGKDNTPHTDVYCVADTMRLTMVQAAVGCSIADAIMLQVGMSGLLFSETEFQTLTLLH